MTNRGFAGKRGLVSSLIVALSLGASPANAIVVADPVPDYTVTANWTDEALAAQTIFVCSSSGSLKYRLNDVKRGLGGIALVGNGASKSIKSQIQGDELRVSSKSRDDLQDLIALLRGKDLEIDLQFTNYR